MATDTIQLAENNFKLVPEGEEVVLKITKAVGKPKAKPEVFEVTFTHESGAVINNKYNIKIDGGLVAFSILARCILGSGVEDFSVSQDLPKFNGKSILCEVAHVESNGNTYANIKKTKKVIELEDTSNEEDEEQL